MVLGLLLGIRHAFEADHIAAVATLWSRAKTLPEFIRFGFLWGTGHTLTLLFFGSSVLFFDKAIPKTLANKLEIGVGFMLILLGFDVVRRILQKRLPSDVLDYERAKFSETQDPQSESTGTRRALFIGLLHGMAGSSALILVTLERTPSIAFGLLHILLFGFGSLLGMVLVSSAIAISWKRSAQNLIRTNNTLQWAVGITTMAIGCLTIYQFTWTSLLNKVATN